MFYQFIRLIALLLMHLFWLIEVIEEEAFKKEGSFILAANHVSYLDPIVLGVVFKRQIIFIAKKEIFEVPILGVIVKLLGAIPVDRKRTNTASMKKSLFILKDGCVLG
ncbi:MAG: 1-acyl-sn-glycerol-3-phosphate acyltransferase, partial [Candidatus Atribacteria bacterium]|nr:1-acyl-sn-glycerol-3-phosphate acyltransferase [Candidatus Atribacteria bacterium]